MTSEQEINNVKEVEKTIICSAYDWEVIDLANDDGSLAIHAWCMDRDSKPYLLRINDFPAFCHIELPSTIGGREYTWSVPAAQLIVDWLNDKGIHSLFSMFKWAQKLYYYRGDRTYPMILIGFRSIADMKKCKEQLSQARKIPHLGIVACRVWETDIPIVRKLLTQVDVAFSGWFRVNGVLVTTDKISTLDEEYIISWRSMKAVPEEESQGWMTYPRILAYDIETYSDNHRRFPIEWYSKDVVYMISCVYQVCMKPETRKYYTVIMADCNYVERENDVVIKVSTEAELCYAFAKIVRETDPEVVTGYNITGFDNKFLNARLERRMQTWPQMGRLIGQKATVSSKTWKSSGYGYNHVSIIQMNGRISVDMLPIIKRDHKLPKYTLDYVANHFLNKGKHDITPVQMFQIYKQYMDEAEARTNSGSLSEEIDVNSNDKPEMVELKDEDKDKNDENLCKEVALCNATIDKDREWNFAKDEMERVRKYCVEDSVLVVDLLDELNTWIGLVELSNIVGVTMMELFTRGQQVRVLSQLYDTAAKQGFVLDERVMKKVKFGGGFVNDPVRGLWDSVLVFDFRSLYPSVIEAFNICYTTLVPEELMNVIPDDQCHVIEWSEEYDADDAGADEDPEEMDEEEELDEDGNVVPKQQYKKYKFKFMKEPQGILPKVVHELVNRRNDVRRRQKGEKNPLIWEVLEKRQLALKISANSMYGALGAQEGGAVPLIEGAMSVTAKGRELILFCNKYLKEKHDARIIYNDSVSADTPILIRNNGIMKWITIDTLAEFQDINGSDDKQRVFFPDSKIEIWSDKGWTKIKQVIRHKTPKRMYRVSTHTGSVDVTEDHSLLRPDGTEVSPNQLKVGEYLLHKDLPIVKPEDEIPCISKEEAWVWGFFYADGSCGMYEYKKDGFKIYKSTWAINNQNMDFLKHAQTIMTAVEPEYTFPIYPCMESSGVDKLCANGPDMKKIVRKYRALFYDHDKHKKVPDMLLVAPEEVRMSFMNGYYAGDGLKNSVNLVFDNKGKIGSAALYHLSKSLGYNVSVNVRDDKEDIYRCTLSRNSQRKNPDVIKKITDLGPCDGYVYDIETESHHFSCGVGRIVVHNTDSTMIDIGLKDSSLIYAKGKELEKEISALFPPPLYLEFEKGGRILTIKKKNYVFWKVNEKGEYTYNKDGSRDFMFRGIPLARRDNCQWQRDIYLKTLTQIMVREPLQDVLSVIFDEVLKLLTGQITWDNFIIIRSLGANYKSENYFMKVFGENLRSAGRPSNPGDRLEYLIVKPHGWNGIDKLLLGHRMRIPEMYHESLETDKPDKIDFQYYLFNLIAARLEQLMQVAYAPEFEKMEAGYKERDYELFFTEMANRGYRDIVVGLWQLTGGDKEKIVNALLMKGCAPDLVKPKGVRGLKGNATKLRTKFLTRAGRKQLVTRIDHRPLRMFSKILKFRTLLISSIPFEVENVRRKWAGLPPLTPAGVPAPSNPEAKKIENTIKAAPASQITTPKLEIIKPVLQIVQPAVQPAVQPVLQILPQQNSISFQSKSSPTIQLTLPPKINQPTLQFTGMPSTVALHSPAINSFTAGQLYFSSTNSKVTAPVAPRLVLSL